MTADHDRTAELADLMPGAGSGALPLGLRAWPGEAPLEDADEARYERLVLAAQRFLDEATQARPPADLVTAVTAQLEAAADAFAGHQVAERQRWSGLLPVAGRGHLLLPPYVVDTSSPDEVRGRVRFGRAHLGGGGAAHGGSLPLFFDDVIGLLAGSGGRSPSRTAYLHVDYRAITPLDRELGFAVRYDREEGRKRFLTGWVRDGDVLVAEAEALFVALRPGQP